MLVDLWTDLGDFFGGETMASVARAAMVLMVGLSLAIVLSRGLAHVGRKRWSADQAAALQRVSFYVLCLLVVAWTMRELGLRLSVLLGAAGVVSVAIGFASQTSLSNAISGLLLLGEKPFRVGEIITVEGETGEVVAVDLLSTKLRTYNNQYVRIPNELLLKSKVVNLTRFPIRRLDLRIPVAYDEDLDRVRRVLLGVAEREPLCLDEPPPFVFITEFGESQLYAQFSIWCETRNWLKFNEVVTLDIKRALDQEQIRFPYPRRVQIPGPPLA